MKATEQYFPMLLFTTLYKLVLSFESVDEILTCDHSNETPLSSTFLYKVVLTFESVDEILSLTIQMNP